MNDSSRLCLESLECASIDIAIAFFDVTECNPELKYHLMVLYVEMNIEE
jgi:hypothetical protein